MIYDFGVSRRNINRDRGYEAAEAVTDVLRTSNTQVGLLGS